MENHHFSWENSLFQWPFSIAFCMFTRPGTRIKIPPLVGLGVNSRHGALELHLVAEDLYLYPAPRSRPPALRPGMKQYGEAAVFPQELGIASGNVAETMDHIEIVDVANKDGDFL